MSCLPPVDEYELLLTHVAGLDAVLSLARFAGPGPGDIRAILEEAARLSTRVLAPLNQAGDRHPARLEGGVVRTSPGFAGAYAALRSGGWLGMSASREAGGMGLPSVVVASVLEMMAAANLSLQLNPMLTLGQIHALELYASPELKAQYLPKLISGAWSGTMVLTEPQAGTDLGALTARAEPEADGSYRISGQKIFTTWGGADFLEGISHLVLARLPDAPPGSRGISLFLVPSHLPETQAGPGRPNAVEVVGLEHKMGLHGSPTAVMQFSGATGWLVGAPHSGMKAMFAMMNMARLSVGMQGVGVAEAAFRKALAYAQERRQGPTASGEPGIIGHADVRRMLAEMKAEIRAARGIALMTAAAGDLGQDDPVQAAKAALLTPVAKGFGTETGMKVASMGLQIHGGSGYIEETGAAQYVRDVRITAIYEGTNGIQAMDLVGRKLADDGAAMQLVLDEIAATITRARPALPELAGPVEEALSEFRAGVAQMLALPLQDRFAGADAFARAFARLLGAQVHLLCAAAEGPDGARARLATIYMTRLLPELRGLLSAALSGAGPLWALSAPDLED